MYLKIMTLYSQINPMSLLKDERNSYHFIGTLWMLIFLSLHLGKINLDLMLNCREAPKL